VVVLARYEPRKQLADQYAGHDLGPVGPPSTHSPKHMYHAAFHDITSGDNTYVVAEKTMEGYEAGPGWDPVTGWGQRSPRSSYLCRRVTGPHKRRRQRHNRTVRRLRTCDEE
jgi:hypothetical protein